MKTKQNAIIGNYLQITQTSKKLLIFTLCLLINWKITNKSGKSYYMLYIFIVNAAYKSKN